MASITSSEASAEVRERLLKAWRGEIVAGSVYELIARRMPEREADILRRMAQAESGHRSRLEARMRELDIEVPEPSSVRIPLWLRLQARIAPVDRLLAAREAAEDDEVDDLYKRSTGDQVTDQLLRSIRKEERSHSLAVQELRSGSDPGDGDGARAAGARGDFGSSREAPIAVPGARDRLDRILGREKWHRTGGGWISGAIYGANDGLAAVFGIVAGVSGATGGSSSVLTAGLAGAIASALSMATGAFLAERSEAEVAAANVERERQEIAEHPEEEKEELSLFYQLKGIDQKTADELAERMSRHPDAMLQALATEEFGASVGSDGNAGEAALAAGVSTGLGAIVPVIPFMITTGTAAIVAAAVVSLVAHFLVGAAKSLVTLRTWWSAGLEMTLAGVIVGGATYIVGLALPT
ncbi:MAG: VIT1/CCC1 transporter family protein [Solirubrobacterales bacterium]|nr:VIT1/CCC1 transporter family protein [Solirubrobacterales bacterium]MBV9916796.1 VIT1/CCC1 transporter family protein [Solirubrobacterales bacterium]